MNPSQYEALMQYDQLQHHQQHQPAPQEQRSVRFPNRPERPYVERTQAAREGLALLRRGSAAKKLDRHGALHTTIFKLSADDSVLGWEARGVNRLKRRAVCLADVVEVLAGPEDDAGPPSRLGREEAAAPPVRVRRSNSGRQQQRSAAPDGAPPLLALSLRLRGGEGGAGGEGRPRLELRFDEAATFALWVAALGTLLDEHDGVGHSSSQLLRAPQPGGGYGDVVPPPTVVGVAVDVVDGWGAGAQPHHQASDATREPLRAAGSEAGAGGGAAARAQLEAMGFARVDAEAALACADGNGEDALELLLSGAMTSGLGLDEGTLFPSHLLPSRSPTSEFPSSLLDDRFGVLRAAPAGPEGESDLGEIIEPHAAGPPVFATVRLDH